MVLPVGTPQNLQRVLSNFLFFFWNFGLIWKLLKIYRTFFEGSAKLLFFQSIAFYLDMLFNCRWINFFDINRCMIVISCLFTYDGQVLWLLMMLLTFDNCYHRWYGYYHIIHLSRFCLIKSSGMSSQFNYWILLLQQNASHYAESCT